ncbi:MAG TPA: hypothetical protein VGG13_01810 [Candidatus Saccharimonadales bacterium]|jgi:hypothetical protein
MKSYKNTKLRAIILVLVYAVSTTYWYILTLHGLKTSSANYWYQVFLAIIPLLGALFGFVNSAHWGGLKSQLGRAIFFLSAGLAAWGLGQCYWSYATIRQISQIPYPSWADVGYVTALPFWIAGMLALTSAAGARFSFKKHTTSLGKLLASILAALVVVGGSALVIVGASGGIDLHHGSISKHLVDLAYPTGDVIIITIAVVSLTLLRNYLGGRYKAAIMIIIVGFILMYVTDSSFAYVINNNTYFNGHLVDFLFSTVMAILSWGIVHLAPPTGYKKAPPMGVSLGLGSPEQPLSEG